MRSSALSPLSCARGGARTSVDARACRAANAARLRAPTAQTSAMAQPPMLQRLQPVASRGGALRQRDITVTVPSRRLVASFTPRDAGKPRRRVTHAHGLACPARACKCYVALPER
jgi:hypothetical protein